MEKESIVGADAIRALTFIYAWTGEKDRAFEELAIASRIPAGYGELKPDPFFDPLRGDPRFDAVVASLAPKQL